MRKTRKKERIKLLKRFNWIKKASKCMIVKSTKIYILRRERAGKDLQILLHKSLKSKINRSFPSKINKKLLWKTKNSLHKNKKSRILKKIQIFRVTLTTSTKSKLKSLKIHEIYKILIFLKTTLSFSISSQSIQ